MNDTTRYILLGVALVAIAAAIVVIEAPWKTKSVAPPAPANLSAQELSFPAAPSFQAATGWVNSAPLDLAQLRGKVVLVDFWTYSCINCIHTFPHVEGWYQTYEKDGFVVVGVHTPEFHFERDINNIQHATQMYGLTYPVAVDSDYGVWDAYGNHYWPAEYLIDQYGRVRHTSFGEGNYDETENAIRELLAEAGHAPGARAPPVGDASASAAGITPELYAAAAEGESRVAIANNEGYHSGEDVDYARPASVGKDLIYLVGRWHDGPENVTAIGPDARILVKFTAGGGNVVLDAGEGLCLPVKLDDGPIPPDRVAHDVEATAVPCIRTDGPRSYDFYNGPIETHTVEISVPAGVSLFTFDFAATGRP